MGGVRRPGRSRPRDGLQRPDHLRQVRPHRRLGRVAVAAPDGVDDRTVLAQRLRRSARREHGAELVSHVLGIQVVDQLGDPRQVGDAEDPAVQRRVQLGERRADRRAA